MDAKVFEPFFAGLRAKLSGLFDQAAIDAISSELWEKPFDVVIEKYKIPENVLIESWDLLDGTDFRLDISTYADYHYILKLDGLRFLVTTGPHKLQEAKIKALGIEGDFVGTVINDKFRDSRSKADIFKELMDEFDLDPATTYVIGDNPDSEIDAGNSLGMVTIQVLRPGVQKGGNAVHYISSFDELAAIINS